MLRRPRAREPKRSPPRVVAEPPVLEAVVDVEALGRPQIPDESLFILGVEVSLLISSSSGSGQSYLWGAWQGGQGWEGRRRGAASQLCLLKTTRRSREVTSKSDMHILASLPPSAWRYG